MNPKKMFSQINDGVKRVTCSIVQSHVDLLTVLIIQEQFIRLNKECG